ncbi:peptide ABC transporter permease, partial [Psychrobacter sp. 1U2]
MGRYILKRLLLILPTLFLILLANFVIVQAAPGGPVEQQLALIEQGAKDSALGGNIGASSAGGNGSSTYQGTRGLSEEMVAAINAQYGFDKSAPERFWLMLKNYAQLDFGESFFKGQTVTD